MKFIRINMNTNKFQRSNISSVFMRLHTKLHVHTDSISIQPILSLLKRFFGVNAYSSEYELQKLRISTVYIEKLVLLIRINTNTNKIYPHSFPYSNLFVFMKIWPQSEYFFRNKCKRNPDKFLFLVNLLINTDKFTLV